MGRKQQRAMQPAPAPTTPPEQAPLIADESPIEAPLGITEDVAGEPLPLPHESSGDHCNVQKHADGYGSCVRCLHCKVKIRPQNLGLPCPARG